MEKYLTKLIDALHPFGDVLEVGFGRSSTLIQKYLPRSHTIITIDSSADLWAKKHLTAKIIHDEWQGALPALGKFDAVFFGIDPHENPLFQKMPKYFYTDFELESFCKSSESADKSQVSRFLCEIEQNGQISSEQLKHLLKKFHLKKVAISPPIRSSQLTQFCRDCISFHTRKGSRISCFLQDSVSPAEDLQFLNEIVANPNLDYREEGKVIVIERLA